MPPKKIDFRVVNVSGEDEKYPSSDLNSEKHGPLVQGWISQKFCTYPIDLIIQFNKKITLKKVQLLSHQYLIASKIEFFIGDCIDGEPDFQSAKYTRLGYVELSPNERTDYKARELKSVYLDAEGTFLKFVLHKNFVNRLNIYNQVGLVAINIIGIDPDDEINYPYLKTVEADPTVLAAVKRSDHISPLDDLAFAMYQDSEISQIIRDLDRKKSDCVLAEKYDEAKRLKQAISELYKIGERLARYDIEKRQAIEEEDYEKAKLKKQQIQEYRAETYRQLQQNNLLDFIEPDMRENLLKKAAYYNENASYSSVDVNSDAKIGKDLKDSLDSARKSDNKSPPINTNRNLNTNRTNNFNSNSSRFQQQASPRNNMSDGYKPSTPYDDRIIPALRNNNKSRQDKNTNNNDPVNQQQAGQNAQSDEDPSNVTLNNTTTTSNNDAMVPDQETYEQEMFDPMDGTEEMTEREVREAALMNDCLGKQIVTKLYSKNFQNREDALQEIYNNLNNYKGDREGAKTLMRAAAIAVAKMCKDNVFSIFNNSIKLCNFLLTEFASRHQLGKAEINYLLEKALPVLLHRTGDTNARLRQRAHEYIVEMASYAEIKPLHTVPNCCTVPINLHIAPRLALSRVEIVEDLMKNLGTRDNGLNVDNISKFCSHALEHTSGEVRELAAKLLIQMYRENGNVVRRYLPPDSEMNRRNKKYRILYDAFDAIDGKPIQNYDRYDVSHTPRFNRNIRTPSKSKTPTLGMSSDRKTPISMADESEYNGDNTCMFCGEVNEKFVKQGFEMHYWKSCPMLKQCNECKEIIEVSVQNDHLLSECKNKANYKKCPRCNEAVNTVNQQENEHHFKAKNCTPFDKRYNRCPLCHTNIGQGEETWKEHLMSPNGCPKNNRKSSTVPNDSSRKLNNQRK